MQRAAWAGDPRRTTKCGAPRRSARRSRRGFTVLELLIITVVIAVIASIALPNYVDAKKSANEASAINSMRTLVAAEENYRVAKNAGKYTTLEGLKNAGLINKTLGSGAMSGYTFLTFGVPGTTTFAFTGSPQLGGGDRYFFADHTGVIRVAEDSASLGPNSPPLK